MLALTPSPLQSAGERAFFAELTRWDTGGSVRAAVVASLPRVDDGPLRRRIADAVLFVPEGLAVVRVVEVERQSGTVTASPDGAWTIGPAGRPGEVLQLSGGGSSPLDGLMRAGMDTAVRLRRAGLEPGRIARLTVLVGGVSGLVPEDGDLGEGDQVATLEPRSLLLGIARASRYAGVDNPRLWTTADVRAALEALELAGRGPSVEELNGEAFPYSPYVLRKPELLAPAGLAAAPAAAAPGALARPAEPEPEPPLEPAPGRDAAVPPSPPVPAPDVFAGRTAGDTVAVGAASAPAPAAVDETGGIGGLFAGAARETAAPPPPPPPPSPSPPPPRAPAAVPVPPPARPATAVLTPPRPATAAPMPPLVAPTVRVDPPSPPAEGQERSGWRNRRGLLVVVAAVVLLLAAVAAGVAALGGDPPDPSGGAEAGSASTTAEPPPEGPAVGDTADLEGRSFTAQAVDVAGSCREHAYGEVAEFFAAADCTGLSRALWATQLDGRAVVVSVSRVRMPDTAAARALQSLTDTNGTGNVSDLLRDGVRYTGGPESLAGSEYASAVSGPVVTVVEAAWVQEGAGDPAEIDAVADAGLALETPAFTAG